jgi:hypothetical protein
MVPVVARTNRPPVSRPAARVRLKAITASTSQALLAMNFPDVIWSRPAAVHDVHDGG